MGYQCTCCGLWHDERPTCFGARLPAPVAALAEHERAARVAVSSDQCVLDAEHFFMLGCIDLHVRDSSEVISWTVWSTVSEANFERCSDLWTTEGRETEAPYPGWLSNQIPGYPHSINIKMLVHTQPVGVRPKLEVIDEGHPLFLDQRHGISPERADQLIHAAVYGGTDQETAAQTESG